MKRLLALVILVGLAAAALYYWKDRGGAVSAQAPSGGLAGVSEKLREAGHAVSDRLRDTKVAGSVKAALELNRTLAPHPIDVSAEGTTAVLRGEVPTEDLRLAAERTAAGVPGVTGVRNEIRVNPALPPPTTDGGRSVGETIDDRALEAKVRMAFSLQRGLEGSDLQVSVFKRAVTLSGTVTSEAQRQLALQVARDTAGVTAVTDHVAPPGGGPSAPAATPVPAASPISQTKVGHSDNSKPRRL